MLEGSGLSALLEFGALGLLGGFLFLAYQSYKGQTEFQQEMTRQVIEIVKENTDAQRQYASEFRVVCESIQGNRAMEKEEHKALMDDHRRITEKLTT